MSSSNRFYDHRPHQCSSAGTHAGHWCHWRGILRSHLLLRPVGGEFQCHIPPLHTQDCSRCLTIPTLLIRPTVCSPRCIERSCGASHADLPVGPLRYYLERASRQGCEGRCRALCESYRPGSSRQCSSHFDWSPEFGIKAWTNNSNPDDVINTVSDISFLFSLRAALLTIH